MNPSSSAPCIPLKTAKNPNSCMPNPLFHPRAAALQQGGAHFLLLQSAIPLRPQAHGQRDESIQVGRLSKLFVKAAVGQHELAEAFQIVHILPPGACGRILPLATMGSNFPM